MFNADFYPTPETVISEMLRPETIEGKIFLEPNAGKGDIVQYLKDNGAAQILGCEINEDLRKIAAGKCKIIANDFLTVTSDQVSHIHHIVMNPPFSADEKHILHAWEIAPAGCRITALCNSSTVNNTYTRQRKELVALISEHGVKEDIGEAFTTAERKTHVNVSIIRLQKPGDTYDQEFSGFYMEEEIEDEERGGIQQYNFVRDLVNRYIGAVKVFDKQLAAAVEMNDLTRSFYSAEMAFSCTHNEKPVLRNEFKKDLQKNAWKYIFDKMDLQKTATKGLREDINKFVEQQTQVPFTMRNIYHMLDMVIQTTSQRMDKALLEVFEKLTKHTDENRYQVPGWKTNSHFLINRKFIVPYLCSQERYNKGDRIDISYQNTESIEDLVKALCYISGNNYDDFLPLRLTATYDYKIINKEGKIANADYHPPHGDMSNVKIIANRYGQWFDWSFFRCKAHKKGTMHFEFLDENLWAKFNQRIAKIKGYPLFEPGRRPEDFGKRKNKQTASTLF